MAKLSPRSKKILKTCHNDLQTVMNTAIRYINFSVICGYRGKKKQNKAYVKGSSTLKFPKSRHNKKPSLAVDIIPYPTRYKDAFEFYYLAGVIHVVATILQIKLKWGGTWKSFKDLPHWQLRKVK